jgi:para-aminobenzoate synthetase component I
MNNQTASTQSATFAFADLQLLKKKMLDWVSRFNIFLFLDGQQYQFQPQQYECLVAAGVRHFVEDINAVDDFVKAKRWCFGHLSYDLKNELHGLEKSTDDRVGFPRLYFFEPFVVLAVTGHTLTIEAEDPQAVWNDIQAATESANPAHHPVVLTPRLSRKEYIDVVRKLQQHILRGDCYEINFCQEFFAAGARLNPLSLFRQLSVASPAPFAALYRLQDRYLASASPERFLTKKGRRLIAQPMKGTARRSPDEVLDAALKTGLLHSAKDRSENVMVVDLVRNDLSQVCTEASVQVDELYGVYTFPQVHQMVSTISGELRPDVSFVQLLKATFPMGSMTGAPKLRVMQLIDEYETSARGLFSGSVGYITPNGDFDFNVVIRSVLYNAQSGYVSCPVGSGITFYSDAEGEWEECLLKAAAIRKVLAV